jgi:hypothetical protein
MLLLMLMLLLQASTSMTSCHAQQLCSTAADLSHSTAAPNFATNPLRGFMAYHDALGTAQFPTSLEYSYVALLDVLTQETPPAYAFSFSSIDAMLTASAARGNHMVLRLYVDYPDCCPDGSYNSGVPAFLQTGTAPVTFTAYTEHGGGSSPDYANERLLAAMEATIAALGARYDGHSGIAAFQVGLLGHWGEFHTFPNTALMASRSAQVRCSILWCALVACWLVVVVVLLLSPMYVTHHHCVCGLAFI